jgi:ribosomal protein S17E
LIFEPYNDSYNTSFSNLQKIINLYNKWIVYKSKAEGLGDVLCYPKITVASWLALRNSDQVIGFVNGNIYYYCTPMSKKLALSYFNVNIQHILYNPLTINNMIYSIKSGKKKLERNASIDEKLQRGIYQYYLYNLILLQFISIFNKQRNIPLRKQIISTIVKTNFDKNMDAIKQLINNLNDIEDSTKLKNIIARYITNHHDKKQMLDDVNTSYFNFDRIELEKLKTLDYNSVLDELHRMSKKFVKFGDINKQKKFQFPNILISCDQDIKGQSIDYCSNGKFIVKKNQLDEILSILAYDIINPSKWKWLFNSVFIEKSVDFFKFMRRPNETITIEFV